MLFYFLPEFIQTPALLVRISFQTYLTTLEWRTPTHVVQLDILVQTIPIEQMRKKIFKRDSCIIHRYSVIKHKDTGLNSPVQANVIPPVTLPYNFLFPGKEWKIEGKYRSTEMCTQNLWILYIGSPETFSFSKWKCWQWYFPPIF